MPDDVTGIVTTAIGEQFLNALWKRVWCAQAARPPDDQKFTSVAVHPADWNGLYGAWPEVARGLEITPWGHKFIRDLAIHPGDAELRATDGDRWRFRWDPRWRCGGCGKVIPNEEQHDPAFVVPFCPDCARVRRPGMYGPSAGG